MSDAVLVTGATGLLGSAVVAALLESGRPVRALVRDPERAARLLPADAEPVTGDTLDPEVWDRVLPGVSAVVHGAAYFREFYEPGADPGVLYETNVDALIRLLGAAHRHAVARVVHVSSTAALAKGGLDAPAGEASPPPSSAVNGYAASKVAAEAVVRAHLARADAPAVPMVLPGWMWGPGDSGPTSAGRLFLALARRELPALPDVGNTIVDVRDVAQVCARLVDGGSGRYVAAGRWVPLRELARAIAGEVGVRPPVMLPGRLTLGLAGAMERLNRITGRENVSGREGVQVLLDGHPARFASHRVERELGITWRPLSETVHDEAEWFRRHGRL